MDLKAFKTIKYFIISARKNKIGFLVEVGFGGFYWRFFWVGGTPPPKNCGFCWVCTRVSEPWPCVLLQLVSVGCDGRILIWQLNQHQKVLRLIDGFVIIVSLYHYHCYYVITSAGRYCDH